ncbi:hypothetical protein [Vibrio splendidus]|uniref:hypothetical protein n=1 Tax=Vibrio splendidus TaxID=29497 RepID=UPI000C853B69|nr:hypothetical protein [Vibrio splendidus]PMK36391.1 hypothetical protein BCU01_21740 [Vibrio splendidus]
MVLSNSVSTQSSQHGVAVTTTGPNSPVSILTTAIPQMTSLLTPLFDRLIQVHKPYYVPTSQNSLPDETEDKIEFNRLNVLAPEIRDLAGFLTVIENAIDDIDAQEPGSKDQFLWAIHQRYKSIKQRILIENNVDISDANAIHLCISNNADSILLQVTSTLFEGVTLSIPTDVDTLQATQQLVSCYGFINCRILEKPSDYQ